MVNINIFNKIKSDSACLVVGQSKYMVLSHFIKRMSITRFRFLRHAGANVDLSNGLCFVE